MPFIDVILGTRIPRPMRLDDSEYICIGKSKFSSWTVKSISLDAFSSRSSSLFNYFANLTNFEQTWDQYQTASTQTQNNIAEDQDGEWVWVPKGSKYQIVDDDITYQDNADDRQDFLSLFNPSQLVFDNNTLR